MTFKKWSDAISHIRKTFPEAKSVPVGMGKTAYSVYENDFYANHIFDLEYEYHAGSIGSSMFGYDYKLVKINSK